MSDIVGSRCKIDQRHKVAHFRLRKANESTGFQMFRSDLWDFTKAENGASLKKHAIWMHGTFPVNLVFFAFPKGGR